MIVPVIRWSPVNPAGVTAPSAIAALRRCLGVPAAVTAIVALREE